MGLLLYMVQSILKKKILFFLNIYIYIIILEP